MGICSSSIEETPSADKAGSKKSQPKPQARYTDLPTNTSHISVHVVEPSGSGMIPNSRPIMPLLSRKSIVPGPEELQLSPADAVGGFENQPDPNTQHADSAVVALDVGTQTVKSSDLHTSPPEDPAVSSSAKEQTVQEPRYQQPPSEPQAAEKVIALFEYEARIEGDLSFKKGDIMDLLDSSNPDWWFVRDTEGLTGYVRRNFFAKQQAIESEEWFAGHIPRSRAERLVLENNLPKGTFLIRKRDAGPGKLALTVRDSDEQKGNVAKHYKIKGENGAYHISSKPTFPTLRDLVQHYSETGSGLCCQLTFPAPRVAPRLIDLSYETQTNWEIPRDQLQLERQLGVGHFGEVWYGKWRGMVEVAIKTMKPGKMSPEAFLEEVQIMKQCDDPNLIKLYAVCSKEEPIYIIIEYMCNGSLVQYLRQEEDITTLEVLVDISAQVASGMKYLEQKKLVHRDLAARNVLVGEKTSGVPLVKVADFGLARKLMEAGYYRPQTEAKIPIKWTALEAILRGTYTIKSDVWSYGILLYEIMTKGKIPYPGMNNAEVLEQLENDYRMSCPKDCPEKIYEIMLKCWDKNPEQRPTFDLLFHFFDDYFESSQPDDLVIST